MNRMTDRKAIGFIETEGLPAAIAASDAALKSANVVLIGRENSRGAGLMTVKIMGDIGAVKAALESARSVSNQVRSVRSVLAIPRPAPGIGESFGWNENTIGAKTLRGVEKEGSVSREKDADATSPREGETAERPENSERGADPFASDEVLLDRTKENAVLPVTEEAGVGSEGTPVLEGRTVAVKTKNTRRPAQRRKK